MTPATKVTLYICEDDWQGVALPVIASDRAGTVAGITANICAVPLPQAFEGVTCIFPEPAPTVTVTEFVVPPAVCIHPAGNVQV